MTERWVQARGAAGQPGALSEACEVEAPGLGHVKTTGSFDGRKGGQKPPERSLGRKSAGAKIGPAKLGTYAPPLRMPGFKIPGALSEAGGAVEAAGPGHDNMTGSFDGCKVRSLGRKNTAPPLRMPVLGIPDLLPQSKMPHTVKYLATCLLIAGLLLAACTPAASPGAATAPTVESLPGAANTDSPTPAALPGDVLPPTVTPTLPASPAAVLTETTVLTPTTAALVAATQPASPAAASPSPAPDCIANLTYIADLTIPDGTTVQPGELLEKQWQVENSGTCSWQRDYRLKLVAGDEMGAAVEQALYPARAGAQAAISLQFIAPSEPGVYRSAWQAYDPQDEPFGDPIFIDIVVASP